LDMLVIQPCTNLRQIWHHLHGRCGRRGQAHTSRIISTSIGNQRCLRSRQSPRF
jgi:hypothetical protein